MKVIQAYSHLTKHRNTFVNQRQEEEENSSYQESGGVNTFSGISEDSQFRDVPLHDNTSSVQSNEKWKNTFHSIRSKFYSFLFPSIMQTRKQRADSLRYRRIIIGVTTSLFIGWLLLGWRGGASVPSDPSRIYHDNQKNTIQNVFDGGIDLTRFKMDIDGPWDGRAPSLHYPCNDEEFLQWLKHRHIMENGSSLHIDEISLRPEELKLGYFSTEIYHLGTYNVSIIALEKLMKYVCRRHRSDTTPMSDCTCLCASHLGISKNVVFVTPDKFLINPVSQEQSSEKIDMSAWKTDISAYSAVMCNDHSPDATRTVAKTTNFLYQNKDRSRSRDPFSFQESACINECDNYQKSQEQ